MREFIINKARTCAVTGHRILPIEFNREALKEIFKKITDDGYDTFLIGMAIGFDTLCFNILEELKKENENIRIIACVPCPEQSERFSVFQKNEYDRMISVADEKIILSERYSAYCMKKRNKYMVDNCSLLIAFLNRDFGGSYNTVKYAEEKNVKILKI